MCANYFWYEGIYIILTDTGLFHPPPSFEMGSDESNQDETGSESEDTGSPGQAIQSNVQAQSTGVRW